MLLSYTDKMFIEEARRIILEDKEGEYSYMEVLKLAIKRCSTSR